MTSSLVLVGFVVAAIILFKFLSRASSTKEVVAQQTLDDVSGLGDNLVPTSIHPEIDKSRCIGSGACVQACPEHDVIGIIRGTVELLNPLACVGHGACATACPVQAIELVFGTAKRGVELRELDETFETSQEGVYVVGELGGMGLIRNAIRQGTEVGEYIAAAKRRGDGADMLDAVVVGSGPAGISATLSLMQEGLSVTLLEGDSYGGTISHYPRAKVVMTGPLEIPGMPKVKKRTMSKEELLELWETIRSSKEIALETGQEVVGLEQTGAGWRVITKVGEYSAANVVLALGRRGSPRKLGIPGEELQKVCYRLLEPDPFAQKHVLIVGGGNSAAECAIALAEFQGCASVGISYRRGEFARLRAQVRQSLLEFIESGAIQSHLQTQVTGIDPNSVTLSHSDGQSQQLQNDAVVVQIGGTPPSALLDKLGIATVEKRGEA